MKVFFTWWEVWQGSDHSKSSQVEHKLRERRKIIGICRMAMFGLIVSGRLVSTSWEQASPTNVVAEIQVHLAIDYKGYLGDLTICTGR